MTQPTKPGFLPPYSSATRSAVAVVLDGLLNPTGGSPMELRRHRAGRVFDVVELPAPDHPGDGFNAPAADRILAGDGWRRTTEWDWPESLGAYIAGIERI